MMFFEQMFAGILKTSMCEVLRPGDPLVNAEFAYPSSLMSPLDIIPVVPSPGGGVLCALGEEPAAEMTKQTFFL